MANKIAYYNNKGFTLVEIMLVIIIIAVLTAMAGIYYGNQALRSKTFNAEYYMINLSRVLELYNINLEKYPADLTYLTTYEPKYFDRVYCSDEGSTGEDEDYKFLCEELSEQSFKITAKPKPGHGTTCWKIQSSSMLSKKDYDKLSDSCLGEWRFR